MYVQDPREIGHCAREPRRAFPSLLVSSSSTLRRALASSYRPHVSMTSGTAGNETFFPATFVCSRSFRHVVWISSSRTRFGLSVALPSVLVRLAVLASTRTPKVSVTAPAMSPSRVLDRGRTRGRERRARVRRTSPGEGTEEGKEDDAINSRAFNNVTPFPIACHSLSRDTRVFSTRQQAKFQSRVMLSDTVERPNTHHLLIDLNYFSFSFFFFVLTRGLSRYYPPLFSFLVFPFFLSFSLSHTCEHSYVSFCSFSFSHTYIRTYIQTHTHTHSSQLRFLALLELLAVGLTVVVGLAALERGLLLLLGLRMLTFVVLLLLMLLHRVRRSRDSHLDRPSEIVYARR